MDEKKSIRKEVKLVCPQCGKALPVRILELKGKLRYSLVCRNCKAKSEVEIQENI
jgi:transcription elongation factor Elf1